VLVEEQVGDLFVAGFCQILNHVSAVDQTAIFSVDLTNAGVGDGDTAQTGVERDFALFFHWNPLIPLIAGC